MSDSTSADYPSRTAGSTRTLADAIDDELAQTQCRECGYPDCRSYAEAIVDGETANRCRPGGEPTWRAVRSLLERSGRTDGATALWQTPLPDALAVIAPEHCIGCARCLPACPVDAIVGAQGFLHTVLPEVCTGCGLCLPPCPVDCIALPETATATSQNAVTQVSVGERTARRARYEAHQLRAEQLRRARRTRSSTRRSRLAAHVRDRAQPR